MRKLTSTLVIASIFLLLPVSVISQVNEVRLSSWFGFRDIECERFAPTEHLDFINYLEANKEYPEDEYLGLKLFMDFDGPWQTELAFAFSSGWDVNAYNLKLKYFPSKYIGLSAGILRNPHYIYYFEEYLYNRDLDYYTDVRNGSNHKYLVAADKGFMAGLVLPLNYRFLHLTLHLNGGASSIRPFREDFGQKRINSNFRRDLVFESRESYNWFFFPEATFSMDVFRIKNVRIGIQAQASWFLTQKYLNYTLTTYEWTYDNPIVQQIKSPSHRLERLEYDIGLVVRW